MTETQPTGAPHTRAVSADSPVSERTTCVVVGGGPAGLMLGLLLARSDVHVTVLEKHRDFLRDFRGDTVHPATLGLLDDLGLFDKFAALPHSRITRVDLPTADGGRVTFADFGRLPLRHPYIAMVPQWDLLDLLADAARNEPTFDLRMEHEVTGLVRENGRVVGVDVNTPNGPGRLRADLVVACDGRWSQVRHDAHLPAREFPVGFDVWWFRVPTSHDLRETLLPRMARGKAAVVIPREGYAQLARLGRKGSDSALRADGLEALRIEIAELVPELAGDLGRITSMDDVKHLDVRVDRLRRWSAPGVLCIGDAAHAMSPVGGVGINLAVQDAVATARLLAKPLKDNMFDGSSPDAEAKLLAKVQRRRTVPTVIVQSMQRVMHRQAVMRVLDRAGGAAPTAVTNTVRRLPWIAAVPAFLIGIGPRPERIPRWARRTAPASSSESMPSTPR